MKNAVIYARFSSHRQDEQSIEGQLHVCYDYAAREGLTVVGEYIDRALTGRSDVRPGFQRMIEDSRKKAFQYVLVYKLDRFARNRYDSAVYKHKLKQFGVKVLSAMESIGDNPESIILEAVLEASAEYYSVDLAQKILRGRRESAMKGRFVGGTVPLGYKSHDGALSVDEAVAPHITWAFQAYADGTPKKEIIAELNRRGLRNRRGDPCTQSTLTRVFRSEKYVGVLEQDGIRIEGGCPALVERDVFDRVQKRLDLMRHAGAKNKAEVEYLLTGKLYCGHCGNAMVGVSGTGSSGRTWCYYQCKGRRGHACTKKHERRDLLERYIVEKTKTYILAPDRIRQIAESVVAEYDREFGDSPVAELEKRIAWLNRELEKLALASVDMPKALRQPLFDKAERYDAERQDLEIDLAKLRIAHNIRITAEEIEAWLRSFCDGDPEDEDYRRRMIDTFIQKVYVFDDRLAIYYNVRGGEDVTYTDMQDSFADAELPDGDDVCISGEMDHHLHQYPNPVIVYIKHTFGLLVWRGEDE